MKKSEKKIFVIGGLMIAAIVIYNRTKFKVKNIINTLPGSKNWAVRELSKITDITIHHAASSNNATALDFARYHVNEKGWPGIGYHFVIDRSGNIFQTNDLKSVSYHNGYNNTNALGVSMVGNMELEEMTAAQSKALLWLIRKLKRQVKSIKYLVGHKEYVPGHTVCPGAYVNMDYLRNVTNLDKRPASSTKALYFDALKMIYHKDQADN